MVLAHRSYPPVSRCQRLVIWRRICPDESECKIFVQDVFPRRRSPSRCLSPPSHQTGRVLNTEVRLVFACLCFITCASYDSTRLLRQKRTHSSQLFGISYKRLVPCLNRWLSTLVRAAGPLGIAAAFQPLLFAFFPPTSSGNGAE